MPYNPLLYTVVTVVTVVTGSAYTMQETDQLIVLNLGTPAATQINLVANPVTGKTVHIKDGAGNANSDNITVAPAAGNIDGATTQVINSAYGHMTLCYNGTQWNQI